MSFQLYFSSSALLLLLRLIRRLQPHFTPIVQAQNLPSVIISMRGFGQILEFIQILSIDNITPEIVINHNVITKSSYDFYLGAGAILNNINGIIIPVGIGIKPFENLRDLSFNIEFNPIYEFDLNNLFVRGFLGIRYKLN